MDDHQKIRFLEERLAQANRERMEAITALEMEKMIDQWAASRAKQLADNLGR